MIDQEVYDLSQTGDEVQAILNNAEGMPTPEQLSEAFALKADKLTTYTKTEVDAKETALNDRETFIERGLGKYDNTRSVTLQQATAGKYVNVNGQEVSASGYGISAEVQLNAGDIMLVQIGRASCRERV